MLCRPGLVGGRRGRIQQPQGAQTVPLDRLQSVPPRGLVGIGVVEVGWSCRPDIEVVSGAKVARRVRTKPNVSVFAFGLSSIAALKV